MTSDVETYSESAGEKDIPLKILLCSIKPAG